MTSTPTDTRTGGVTLDRLVRPFGITAPPVGHRLTFAVWRTSTA
jgi:hypothetical protein